MKVVVLYYGMRIFHSYRLEERFNQTRGDYIFGLEVRFLIYLEPILTIINNVVLTNYSTLNISKNIFALLNQTETYQSIFCFSIFLTFIS